MKKRIVQNYIYSLGYQLLTLMIPFITIPYVTRVLGPENLGIEAYTMSITAIFVAFATAGSAIFGTRMVASFRDEQETLAKEVYNLLILKTILALAAISVFFLVTMHSKYQLFLLFQLLYLIASTLLDFNWYFSGKEQFKKIVMRNFTAKITGFILILLFVKDADDLIVYIAINASIVLLPNLYFAWLFFREIGPPKTKYFSEKSFRMITKALLPFFFLTVITQIYMNVDKIVIEHLGMTYELGIYNQIIKTFNVFLAPITAIGTILMPYISHLSNGQSKQQTENIIHSSTNFIFLLGMPIFFGLLVTSRQFMQFYFGSEFLAYTSFYQLACLLIITGSLSNIVIQQIVLPRMQEGVYIKGLLLASVFRVAFMLFFIDWLGIYSALLAYILGESLLLLWCMVQTKKVINLFPMIFNQNNFKIFGASAFMYVILLFLNFHLAISVPVGFVFYFLFIMLLKENLITNFLHSRFSKRKEAIQPKVSYPKKKGV